MQKRFWKSREQTSTQCLQQFFLYQTKVKLFTLSKPTIVSYRSFLLYPRKSLISFIAWEQYLSDVGGAAGLVLGMSFATILGMFDCMVLLVFDALKSFLKSLSTIVSGTNRIPNKILTNKTSAPPPYEDSKFHSTYPGYVLSSFVNHRRWRHVCSWKGQLERSWCWKVFFN